MLEESERKELKRLIGPSEREEIEAYVEQIEMNTMCDAWSDIVLRSAIWLAGNGYRVTTYSLAVAVQMAVRNMGTMLYGKLEDYWDDVATLALTDDLLRAMSEERGIPILRPATEEDES